MLKEEKIALIGMGKMGGILVSGLIRNRVVTPENLVGTTRHQKSAEKASEEYGIEVLTDNVRAVEERDLIILAVKPQNMAQVLEEIRDSVREDQLIITLAAAISTRFVEDHLGAGSGKALLPVVRAMPNTPCTVNEGMTVLCPGRLAQKEHLERARAVFDPVGIVESIDNEELMDAVTALSGSGPAYGYIFIESLAEGGVKEGIPRDLATTLAAQTILGAAKMVLETGEHPAKLKDAVTTPAGTTVDGLLELEEGGVRVSLIKAVSRATEKSKDLSS